MTASVLWSNWNTSTTGMFHDNRGKPAPQRLHSGFYGFYWSKGWWRWWWHPETYAKLQSSHHRQRTNTQLFYGPDVLPVAQPTASEHWRKKHNRFSRICPHAQRGYSHLVCRLWNDLYCVEWDVKLYYRTSPRLRPWKVPGYIAGRLPRHSSALGRQHPQSSLKTQKCCQMHGKRKIHVTPPLRYPVESACAAFSAIFRLETDLRRTAYISVTIFFQPIQKIITSNPTISDRSKQISVTLSSPPPSLPPTLKISF